MIQTILLDANYNNGVFMIAIFAVVCVVLVGILLNFVFSGQKKKETDTDELQDYSK